MSLPRGAAYPVFPQPIPDKGATDQRNSSQRGLTLLDYLAAQALPVAEARLQSQRSGYSNGPAITEHAAAAQLAAEAYDIAEAMLNERQRRNAPSTPNPTA